MKKYKLLKHTAGIVTILSMILMISVIVFVFIESLPFLKTEGILALIKPGKWKPIAKSPSFSIFNLIIASLYIFIISIGIALPISIGSSLFISMYIKEKYADLAIRFINILAGIPSVVMGFIGLVIVVKTIEENTYLSSGESILAGGIVVSAMIIPFIMSVVVESLIIIKKRFKRDSDSLGIDTEYFIRAIAIEKIGKPVVVGVILAFSRVIGETMAVMMVIGNAPIMPKLLGKAETIPGLIAIEMGMAEVGSLHYSALFSSGLILMLIISLVNIVIQIVRNRGMKYEN